MQNFTILMILAFQEHFKTEVLNLLGRCPQDPGSDRAYACEYYHRFLLLE
jgi:hypothetical protein